MGLQKETGKPSQVSRKVIQGKGFDGNDYWAFLVRIFVRSSISSSVVDISKYQCVIPCWAWSLEFLLISLGHFIRWSLSNVLGWILDSETWSCLQWVVWIGLSSIRFSMEKQGFLIWSYCISIRSFPAHMSLIKAFLVVIYFTGRNWSPILGRPNDWSSIHGKWHVSIRK